MVTTLTNLTLSQFVNANFHGAHATGNVQMQQILARFHWLKLRTQRRPIPSGPRRQRLLFLGENFTLRSSHDEMQRNGARCVLPVFGPRRESDLVGTTRVRHWRW